MNPYETVGAWAILNDFAKMVHKDNRDAGWYTDLATGHMKDRNLGEMLMLVVTEVSEAYEGIRKGLMDDHLPHRKMEEVEIADVLIRLFDYAGYRNLDIAGAVAEKLAYNKEREDHKLENRRKEGGKKC